MQTDTAELAGLVLEAVLYGIFCVLTVGALYVLVYRRMGSPLNAPLILTSILMFLLATTQIIIDTATIFDAFIPLNRPNRQARLANISIPINATKRAIFFAMMILGDVIAIYRCFIVWARNWWLIVIPSICSLISAILAYMTIWATQHRTAGMFILKTPWTYGTAIFTLSLVANAIATSLIAYRIWKNEGQFTLVANTRRGRLLPIARIIIESGLLNTAYLVVYITVLQVQKGKGSLPIVADMASPLVGIIFSLVIVRVGLNSAKETMYGTQLSSLRVKRRHVPGLDQVSATSRSHPLTSSLPYSNDTLSIGFDKLQGNVV
ncbi:hypothetical protein E4T56_gene18890 [Termitomyces sp. T112]|nr:hypothetical protein E4T56_gene18890 [Termitomyces sp. T112]